MLGCTDSLACNYDMDANTDDGSCLILGEACDDLDDMTINDVVDSTCTCLGEAIVLGCTDMMACNYNLEANMDDESCEFPGDECDDMLETTENDSLNADCICVGDSIVVDFVMERQELTFAMFPNPTTDEVTLQLNGVHPEVTVQVMDGAGRVVWVKPNISLEGATVFDLSTLSIGTYNVMLSDQRGISVQRLVIQR